MKIKLLVAGILMLAGPAFANKEVGNGGGAYICPDPKQSEFLDLFEARVPGIVTEAGLHIAASEASVEEQIQLVFNRFKPGSDLYKKILSVYQEVRVAKIAPVPEGVQISWPADEKNEIEKSGCHARGIMLFRDGSKSILQDERSLLALPLQQQAAAWVHETIYKFLRDVQKVPDSVSARQIVGHLFSDESPVDFNRAINKIAYLHPDADSHLECRRRNEETSHQFVGWDCVMTPSYFGQPLDWSFSFVPYPASVAKGCKPARGVDYFNEYSAIDDYVTHVRVPLGPSPFKVDAFDWSFNIDTNYLSQLKGTTVLSCAGTFTISDSLGHSFSAEPGSSPKNVGVIRVYIGRQFTKPE